MTDPAYAANHTIGNAVKNDKARLLALVYYTYAFMMKR